MALTPNVVPDAPILSSWGNQVRDRSVQVFATVAERSSQWPTPPVGAVSYITATQALNQYYGGTTGWAPTWSEPWGTLTYVEGTAAQTGIGVVGDVTGLTITRTYIANRRIRLRGQVFLNKSAIGADSYLLIREGTTQLQETHQWFTAVSERNTLPIELVLTPTAGSHTYKLSVGCATGTVDVLLTASAPNFLYVEDAGPNGAPL